MERAGADTPIHQTHVELSRPIASEVEAATPVALRLAVSCSSGCDLRGQFVNVRDRKGVVLTAPLATNEGAANETEELILDAPVEIGPHVWTIVVPRHATEACIHEECVLPIVFTTRPHAASMSVWDVPSPVVMTA